MSRLYEGAGICQDANGHHDFFFTNNRHLNKPIEKSTFSVLGRLDLFGCSSVFHLRPVPDYVHYGKRNYTAWTRAG